MIDVALRTAAVCLWATFALLLVLLLRRRRLAAMSAVLPTAMPTDRPIAVRSASLEEPMLSTTRLQPSVPEPRAEVAYAELSRAYAAEDRGVDAALAQWAADLRILGPLVDTTDPRLPTIPVAFEASGPRAALASTRELVVELVVELVGADSDVSALLGPVDHVSERLVDRPREPVVRTDVNELLARAEELMSTALRIEAEDPAAALRSAREADLASFEALLLESALTHGDTGLISVALRRDLAVTALRQDDARDAAAWQQPTLADEIERVRAVLRDVVEPHELEALAAAFAAGPTP